MEPITDAQARSFLESAPVAHIGVVSHGEPYVTPMSFVMDDNKILFRTKPGRRFEAIVANPVVSIEVSSYDESSGDWTSVIIRGKAYETTDDATVSKTVEKLFQKYREALGSPLGRGGLQPLASFPHVVVVDIEEVPPLKRHGKHTIEAVVDRFRVRPDLALRLAESFETALGLSGGRARVAWMDDVGHVSLTRQVNVAAVGVAVVSREPDLETGDQRHSTGRRRGRRDQ